MNDSAIYELMYSYCRGELLALVTQAINTRETLGNFQARSLGQFIPYYFRDREGITKC